MNAPPTRSSPTSTPPSSGWPTRSTSCPTGWPRRPWPRTRSAASRGSSWRRTGPRRGSRSRSSPARSPRWSCCARSSTAADGDADALPIQLLHDRVLVKEDGPDGERRSTGGIVIPATAQVGKRLVWAEVVGVGPNVRTVQLSRPRPVRAGGPRRGRAARRDATCCCVSATSTRWPRPGSRAARASTSDASFEQAGVVGDVVGRPASGGEVD